VTFQSHSFYIRRKIENAYLIRSVYSIPATCFSAFTLMSVVSIAFLYTERYFKCGVALDPETLNHVINTRNISIVMHSNITSHGPQGTNVTPAIWYREEGSLDCSRNRSDRQREEGGESVS
jgi:hypothetical protein